MKSNTLLQVKNITKEFNGTPCLNRVSFSLEKGELLLIAGANGSGKTLLIKHLNGLYKVKKETLFLKGVDQFKKNNNLKKNIGIVFQNPETQIVSLTVLEDIMFGPLNLGISYEEAKELALTALDRLDIRHLKNRSPYTLSGGELKRVTIAGILVMKPEIIVLDEPFIGLDYPGVKSVIEAIIRLQKSGETIIIITHDLEKVLKYPNRVIIMEKGCIKFNGKPEEALTNLEKYGIRRPSQKSIEEMTWLP